MRDDEKPIPCWKCGVEIPFKVFWKRVNRQQPDPDECKDCKDTTAEHKTRYKWNHPTLGLIDCYPYKYDLDDDWNPITKDGRLFMPGDRICGLKDCVRVSHVKPRVMLVADPVETLLAIVEAQGYKETPSKHSLKGATE